MDDFSKYIQSQMFVAKLHEKIHSKVLETGKTSPSFHQSIKTTPFFLTHRMEAQQPGFEDADIQNRFEGPQSPDQLIQRLKEARKIARHVKEQAALKHRRVKDPKAEQLCQRPARAIGRLLLQRTLQQAVSQVHWTSSNSETKRGDRCFIKMLNSGRKMTVHVNGLKPYHVPPDQAQIKDKHPAIPTPAPPPQLPPRNPQPFQPPPQLPKFQDFHGPVTKRTGSKKPSPPKISALNEGVQKICQTLIEETGNEEQWILIIKKPKRCRPAKPSLQKQLAKQQLINY